MANPFKFIEDIPFLGPIIGGLGDYFTGKETNEANAEQAALNREFQSKEANAAFQRNYAASGTSYQRAVLDLESAGLNPMLAYQQGGASGVSGPSAGGAQATMQNPMSSAIHSALSIQRGKAEVENIRAQTEKTIAETPSNVEGARKVIDAVLGEKYAYVKYEASLKKLELAIHEQLLVPEIAARRAEAVLREQGVPIELSKRAVELWLKNLELPGARFKARGYGMADKGLQGIKEFAEYAGTATANVVNSAADLARGAKHGYERYHSRRQFHRKYNLHERNR